MSDERFEPADRPGARAVSVWGKATAALLMGAAGLCAQLPVPEPDLPRPGAIMVLDVIGEAVANAGDQEKILAPDNRIRVGSTIVTSRMSLVTLVLSNGATLRVGSESELEIEEFGQATVLGSVKFTELKEEPTVSRTRLRLLRGDVRAEVKPLNAGRGSSFTVSTMAGTVRSTEGTFHVRVNMSDLGLGICTLEVDRGAAEFEFLDGRITPLPAGRTLSLALELDRIAGTTKVTEMPREQPKGR